MSKKGFTIVELLVIISIIAMVIAMLVPAISAVKKAIKLGSEKQGLAAVKDFLEKTKIIKTVEPKTVEPKPVEPVVVEKVITKIVTEKYDWKKTLNHKPTAYQLVLIKLHNDIITTGRLTDQNEWKIEIDKMRYKGGSSVEVVSWKEIDIN